MKVEKKMSKKAETPYDRMARTVFHPEASSAPKIYDKIRVFFLKHIYCRLLWGFFSTLDVLARVLLPAVKDELALKVININIKLRPSNRWGGNCLFDYPVAQYYRKQKWDGPCLEIGAADGVASEMFYGNRTVDVGAEYLFGNITNGLENRTFKNVKFPVCSNIYDLPFKDALFNTVLMSNVIHHLSPEKGYSLNELARVMKPGGHLFFNTQSEFFFFNRSIPAFIFERLGLRFISKYFESAMRKEFRRRDTNITGHPLTYWKDVLAKHGFEILESELITSPASTAAGTFFYDRFFQVYKLYYPFPDKKMPGFERIFSYLMQDKKNTSAKKGSMRFIHAVKK